jgi:hypothetical protein
VLSRERAFRGIRSDGLSARSDERTLGFSQDGYTALAGCFDRVVQFAPGTDASELERGATEAACAAKKTLNCGVCLPGRDQRVEALALEGGEGRG